MNQKSDGQEKQERNRGILSIPRGVLCVNQDIKQGDDFVIRYLGIWDYSPL